MDLYSLKIEDGAFIVWQRRSNVFRILRLRLAVVLFQRWDLKQLAVINGFYIKSLQFHDCRRLHLKLQAHLWLPTISQIDKCVFFIGQLFNILCRRPFQSPGVFSFWRFKLWHISTNHFLRIASIHTNEDKKLQSAFWTFHWKTEKPDETYCSNVAAEQICKSWQYQSGSGLPIQTQKQGHLDIHDVCGYAPLVSSEM